MKTVLLIFSFILTLIVGFCFVQGLFAQSSRLDSASSPVRSVLQRSSESAKPDGCIFGQGYCIAGGYVVSGIHIKNQ